MDIRQRILRAMKREAGARLSVIEVRQLARILGIEQTTSLKEQSAEPAKPSEYAGKSDKKTGHIRWMIRRDMPEVYEIERQSFGFGWDEDRFIKALRQRNMIGMVVEIDERVVGFMIYELHKTRLKVQKMAVHAEFRGCSLATQMVDRLKEKLSQQRRAAITIKVAENNLAALLFLKSCGFRATETDGQAIKLIYKYKELAGA